MTITYYDRIDIRIPEPTDRTDVEETDPYHGVAAEEHEEPTLSLDELELRQMHAARAALRDGASGAAARYARKVLGMTQTEAAIAIGYTDEALIRWEDGAGDVPRAAVDAVVRMLDDAIDGMQAEASDDVQAGSRGLSREEAKRRYPEAWERAKAYVLGQATPEPTKVLWTKVTEEFSADAAPEWTDHDLGWRAAMRPSDDGDRPTLDMGKVEPAAVGSAIVWDDDEPSDYDVSPEKYAAATGGGER